MSEEADPPDSGIFGSLPSSRPGSRSPRRTGGDRSKAAAPPNAGAQRPKDGARRKPAAPSPGDAPREAPAQAEPAEETSGGGGIEDLAWAGVAAAAEAATLGVRLANRALEAVRKAADRQ